MASFIFDLPKVKETDAAARELEQVAGITTVRPWPNGGYVVKHDDTLETVQKIAAVLRRAHG